MPGGLGPTELKYRVLEQFPDLFFCDPDYYPVARDDELALALQRFPEIQSNTEEFEAILGHNNLGGQSSFSDEEKLLIYREHKKLGAIQFELDGDAYHFMLLSAKTEGEGEQISGRIDSQGMISAVERTPAFATCPICLAAGTRIDTPAGPVRVEDLRPGMPVWTLDHSGRRAASIIARTVKTAVSSLHQVIHLTLDDGREIWLSAGHPTAGGRRVGELRAGDWLSGARVVAVERVPYFSQYTYDLLPEGETGFYWANGILMASTLK
jgi:hypothetical protein